MATSQKTASTHRSAFVRGTHQLDIVGYSTRKTLGARNPVRSGNFEASGFTWALFCCFDDESLASISLELSRNDTDEAVIAMASLRIDDPTGTGRWPAAHWRSDEPDTFPARSTSAIAWKLAVPDAFQEARYVDKDDDRLTIHCTVHILQEDEDSTAGATRNCFVSLPPPPGLSGDIHRLLRGSWWPDVTFVVEQTKIQAHNLVLAMRSPVFGAEFRGDMKERTMRNVRIDDMRVSTFKAMLHFIYTDEQPKPKKGACPAAMARDLLVTADLYDLERLRHMCENMLSESIGVDTAMATLMLVHGRHSCRQLEASCIEYMASDPVVYDAVKETPEYKKLKESCSSFITDITDKVAVE